MPELFSFPIMNFFFQAPLRNLLRILERGFVLQLEVDIFY